jgi:hypothetical protein
MTGRRPIRSDNRPQKGANRNCEDEYGQVAYALQTLMGPYIDVRKRDQVLAKRWLGGKLRLKTSAEEQRR